MNNRLFVGITLTFLAISVIALLSAGWNDVMSSPSWTISPMGGTMSIGVGEILILVAGTVSFVLLAAWVLRLGGRQK